MKRHFICLFIALSGTPFSVAHSQGMAVHDSANYIQMIRQVNTMAEDYQSQLKQLEQAVKQADAITGTRHMGNIANGSQEQQLRQYLPNTWNETINILDSKSIPLGSFETQSLSSAHYSNYDPLKGEKFTPSDPESLVAKASDRVTGTTYAAMSASEQAFNNVSLRMKTYDTLLEELNQSQDLKASVDLQARIAAENGIIMNELMRLNAIQILQSSSQDNEVLMQQRRASNFNTYDPALARSAMESN